MKTRSYIGIICVFFLVFSSFNTVHPSFVMAADTSMNTTVSETDEIAKNILNGDIVFTAGESFYNGSQKLVCADFGKDCFMSDGRLMADIKLIKTALNLSDDAPLSIQTINKDGTDFVCIEDVGRALDMNVYSGDNRDFVILSHDQNKEYFNSSLSLENEENSDKIWRFMQFDRPTGDEIYKALSDGNLFSSRPRLLIKESEIDDLKIRVQNDKYLKMIASGVESPCKGYMSKDPKEYSIYENRLFSACEEVKYRLFNLCTAYLLTDKEEYAQRAWLEMENALNWADWNTSGHFLDSGEIGVGIAFAYDVLNDYLSNIDGEDKRDWIRERVESLYLDYCVGVFNGTSNLIATRHKLTSSNWGAVCGTSMFMVAMSFMGDEPEDTLLMQKCKYIAENSMLLLEHIATAIAPEGSWFEGMGYYEFVMQHMGWFLETLDNTLSNDFGFLSVKGLADLPDYAMYNQTVNGVFNRAGMTRHTNNNNNYFSPEAFIYAKLSGNTQKTELYNSFRKDMSLNSFMPQYLLFYDASLSDEENAVLSLDKYYSSNGVGVMRDIWEKETGAYVGISGGNGGHYDKGSFIFDAIGERWSVDMGRNGNVTMPFLTRTETHSDLVINPSAGSMGQNNDESAYCIRHESKEKGSLMVYDLSGVYGEWTDEYIRGFYLGDDRNTLTIRDELKLKNESDIVWNMITASEITVSSDGKTAVLSQNGKMLNVTAQCSEENWQFEIAEDLAPTGGWADVTLDDGFGGNKTYTVDSQKEFASGYRKLLLKTKAEGDVKITVKLSPDIYGEEFPMADNEDISNWNIPDGEKREALILNSVKNGDSFNSGKDILISEKIYGNPKSVKLMINDNIVDETTKSYDNTYNLVIPKECLKLAGDTKLTVACEYDNYCSKKDVTIHICREYELKKEQYLDFSRQYSSGVLHCVNKDGYAEYITSDGVLNINIDRALDCGNGEPYIEIPADSEIIGRIADDDIVHISYDLTPGSTSVNFMQAFFGKFKILSAGGKFFEGGSVSYEVNKTYHVEFIINRSHKLYRVYISDMEGNLLAEKRGGYDEPYSFRCRMYISTSSGKGSVVFDNLKLETSKYICPDLNISENAGRYELSGVLKCGGNIDISDHKAYVGYYTEDNAMTHFKEIDIFTSDEVYEELEPSSDTKLIKFFFWDKDLTPITGLKIVDIQSVTH